MTSSTLYCVSIILMHVFTVPVSLNNCPRPWSLRFPFYLPFWHLCIMGVCGWQKNDQFGFRFGFGKTAFFSSISVLQNCSFGFFWFGFLHCVLFNVNVNALYWVLSRLLFYLCFVCFTPLRYDTRNDVLPYWIGPTNCQLKWLRTSAETRHEVKYFDCWSCHVGRWLVNESPWKTIPKPPKLVFFWKPNSGNWVFGFWILRSVRFDF